MKWKEPKSDLCVFLQFEKNKTSEFHSVPLIKFV